MSILTLEGLLVHYEAIGHGQPIIFIHGWLGSWRYWWASMQSMANCCRSFAFDLWGFGDSSKNPSMYDLEGHGQLLNSFLNHLGIVRPVFLVGHALGGIVSLNFAATRPEVVRGVLAVSTPFDGARIHGRLAQGDGGDEISRLIGGGSAYNVIHSDLSKTDSEAIRRSVAQLAKFRLVDALAEVQCPVLLISGDQDPLIDQANFEDNCPEPLEENVRCISLQGCFHYPMLEEPAIFNRLLKDFVQGASPNTITPKEYWRRRMR